MQAVIVAAGRGTRLQSETRGMPKCLIQVGGRPLIDFSLRTLSKLSIGPIGIVVGHRKEAIKQALGSKYEYIFNPFYATTNNLVSSWFAKDFVKDEGVVYLHSDLLYHPGILATVLDSNADIALSVHESMCDQEAMKVVQKHGYLVRSSKDICKREACGEWIGIAKFTNRGWKKYITAAEDLLVRQDFEAYDTKAFTALAKDGERVRVVLFRDLPFIEIDSPADLHVARTETVKRIVAS